MAIETIKKNVGLWVVFDEIDNSVFQSQILNVAGKQCEANLFAKIFILSFEKNILAAKNKLTEFSIPNGVEFILAPKLSFFGKMSLQSCVEAACNQIFKIFPTSIIARGPLAGFICLKALDKVKDEQALLQDQHALPQLIIQARGLLKQEYTFAGKFSLWSKVFFPVRWYIAKQLESIEKYVYSEESLSKMAFSVQIETVSQYLADYLIKEFGATPKRILPAKHDLIECLPSAIIAKNRKETRSKLGLRDDVKVYCYAGSAKPWQCAKETVELFKQKLADDPFAYFLILTQDQTEFAVILKQLEIPEQNYYLTTLSNSSKYLKAVCAADVGVILREENIINWVSRPTKVLDYLACGLTIEHNNTVAWVINALSEALAAKILTKQIEESASSNIKAATRAPKVSLKIVEKYKTTKPKAEATKTTEKKTRTTKVAKTAMPKKSKSTTLKAATKAKPVSAKKPTTKKITAKPANKSKTKKQPEL